MRLGSRSTSVLVSFAADYHSAMALEVTRTFPGSSIERLGPDLAAVTLNGHVVDDLAAAAGDACLPFVRHLSAEVRRLPLAEAQIGALPALARAVVDERAAPGEPVAVQCWVSGEAATSFGSQNLFHRVAEELQAHGRGVRRGGAGLVLSAAVHGRGVSLGLATRRQALSDWPGGRVRLARAKGSVSRAEFKLEELFQLLSPRFPRMGRAVDLGAAPGGWTRVLRERGLEVWSVDPGDLAPSLATDRLVHHERTTAGPFIRSTSLTFDVAVNDMRMTPWLSCETMLQAAGALNPGALAVVTLKLGQRDAAQTVRSCLDLLSRRYRVVFARQLHHNRHEVTVAARLR